MVVNFTLITKEGQTHFQVFGRWQENVLVFPDQTLEKTLVKLQIEKDCIVLMRVGQTRMQQTFRRNELITGSYQAPGLEEFEIAAYTKEMEMNDHLVVIVYDAFCLKEQLFEHKLIISY